MSVSILSDKHYNSVAFAVWSELVGEGRHCLPQSFRNAVILEEHVEAWIDTLRELNQISYVVKYAHHEGTRYEPTQRAQSEGMKHLQRPALCMALAAIVYNIEREQFDGIRELTADEERALAWAVSVRNALANEIVRNLANEAGADWSID